jgi:hypothetical protein
MSGKLCCQLPTLPGELGRNGRVFRLFRLFRILRQAKAVWDCYSSRTSMHSSVKEMLCGQRKFWPAYINIDESPWGDLKGKPLDARRLANILRPYGVESKQVRIGEKSQKGYRRDDLWDVWERYLPKEKMCSLLKTNETCEPNETGDDVIVLFEEGTNAP